MADKLIHNIISQNRHNCEGIWKQEATTSREKTIISPRTCGSGGENEQGGMNGRGGESETGDRMVVAAPASLIIYIKNKG